MCFTFKLKQDETFKIKTKISTFKAATHTRLPGKDNHSTNEMRAKLEEKRNIH